MSTERGRFPFTLRELLVLVFLFAVVMSLLMPFIQVAREEARRSQCINNMKRLGLAFHLHHEKHREMPAASDVTRRADGAIAAVDGWSFVVHLLPYMEEQALYDSLDVANGKPDDPEHAAALDTPLPVLHCPSNSNPKFAKPDFSNGALTNYKAMGATHIESLMVASPNPSTPLYDPLTPGTHPDGALFPGKRLRLSAFGRDGTALTILCVETMDPEYGVWAKGAECTLVGLPSEGLSFEQIQGTFYAPVGYNGKYWDEAPPEIQRLKTYMAYDFAGADPGPYVGTDPRCTFGPSCVHPKVVNHLFADGTVHSIQRDEDFVSYMMLITRNGGDPNPMPD